MSNLESSDLQPEPERPDASTSPPEPSQTNDRNEGGTSHRRSAEIIAEAQPEREVAEPTSDGEQEIDVPDPPGTDIVPPALAADPPVPEPQQVVSFDGAPTRQPPALRDYVRSAARGGASAPCTSGGTSTTNRFCRSTRAM